MSDKHLIFKHQTILGHCLSVSFFVVLHQNTTTKIQTREDINVIIKERAIMHLKSEGRVDGRVTKNIANRIVQVSGGRLLKLERTIPDQGSALEEKDAVIAEKDAVIDSGKKRIAELEEELSRYKEYYGKATRQVTSRNSSFLYR